MAEQAKPNYSAYVTGRELEPGYIPFYDLDVADYEGEDIPLPELAVETMQ
jgi:hypothetical protein